MENKETTPGNSSSPTANALGNLEADEEQGSSNGIVSSSISGSGSGSSSGDGNDETIVMPRNNKKYPQVFYCPVTHNLLEDPVVILDGVSYERSAMEGRGEKTMYSNRALKSILEEMFGRKGWHHSIQQNLQYLIYSQTSSLPEAYYCPITLDLIHVPVIDPEGYTFEKVAIESWIRKNGASPVTRATLTELDLFPNHALKKLMEEEARKADDVMHPMIRRWKEEGPPVIELALTPRANTTSGTGTVTGAGNRIPSNVASNAAAAAAAAAALEARQQELARIRHVARRKCIGRILLIAALVVAAIYVQTVAIVLLVFVVLGVLVFCVVVVVTGCGGGNSTFDPSYNVP